MKAIVNTVILGAPGGGKGTICSKILKDFNFSHLSTGDLLRKNIIDKSSVGLKAQSFMNDGKFVPDEIVFEVLYNAIKSCATSSVLLDGFPRTVTQAKFLNKIINIHAVVSLNIPHEVIVNRMKSRWVHLPSGRTYSTNYNIPKVPGFDDVTGEKLSQRDDDKPEIVKKRLENYDLMAQPLLDFYGNEYRSDSNQNCIVKVFSGTESDVIYPQIKRFMIQDMKLAPKQ